MLLALLLAATPHMTWHGGKVLPAPRYYNLYWGWYWHDNPDEVTWFDGYTRDVAGSWELASQVTEYSVNGQLLGAGSFGGSVVVTGNPAPTITDAELSDFIEKQIEARVVPLPDEHNVYAVFLAPGVKIENEDKALAYHGPTPYGFHEIMVHFDNYVLDVASRDVAAVSYSHEMAENMTDPDLDGWFDDATQKEIGDVCQGRLGFVGVHAIQQEWSEASGGCMAARDVALPPAGGLCPSGTHLEGSDCLGDLLSWGCSSAGAGVPCAFGLLALLWRRRRPISG